MADDAHGLGQVHCEVVLVDVFVVLSEDGRVQLDCVFAVADLSLDQLCCFRIVWIHLAQFCLVLVDLLLDFGDLLQQGVDKHAHLGLRLPWANSALNYQ